MNRKGFHVYAGDIRINVNLSGVMSEKADACIVPHYETGISLTGVSAAFIHSMARNSIIEYQDYARDKKLKPDFAYVASCQGDNYKHLIHIPVLKRKTEKNNKKTSKEDTYLGILSALETAETIKARSVVIPSLNTGSSGVLTYEVAATETIRAIKTYIDKTPKKCIKEITIALKTRFAYDAYLKKVLNCFNQ